jgi:hypothetical protein
MRLKPEQMPRIDTRERHDIESCHALDAMRALAAVEGPVVPGPR